ncbi:MAG: AAA family ATPase [Planctomycetes bacterium]|nr:AAA family ATPase [Planctomycetota bacterium]
MTDADRAALEKVWAERALPKAPASVSALPKEAPSEPATFRPPIPATELHEHCGSTCLAEPIIEPCVLQGTSTLFSSYPKDGKTTWLSHCLPTDVLVLIVTEEPALIWDQRVETLGIKDNVHFMLRDTADRPFPELCRHLAGLVQQEGYALVVIDTLAWFANFDENEENDASQVTWAIRQASVVTRHGAALMIVHHCGKAKRQDGREIRGSSAFMAAVDSVLTMKRVPGHDRRRKLLCKSRISGLPESITYELSEDGSGYDAVDNRDGATVDETALQRHWAVLDSLLPDARCEVGLTLSEIKSAWPGGAPSETTVKDALRAGVKRGRYLKLGEGVRASPRTYKLSDGSDGSQGLPPSAGIAADPPSDSQKGRIKRRIEGQPISPADPSESPESARPATTAEAILARHRGASATAAGVPAETPRRRR